MTRVHPAGGTNPGRNEWVQGPGEPHEGTRSDTTSAYKRWIGDLPQTVIVQPTSFCNLACTYCYLPDRNSRRHMSVDVATAIARSAEALTAAPEGRRLDLVWHAGEPLAVGIPRMAELVAPFDQLRQQNRVQHSVQTNATLITEDWCSFLTGHSFRVGVSIDGPDAMNAQRVDRRGRTALNRILRGISRLHEAEIPFSVIAVVTVESMREPDTLLDFLASLGCHTIGLNIEEREGVSTVRITPGMARAAEFWRRTIAWSRRNPGVPIRDLVRLGDYLHLARTGRLDRWAAQPHDPLPAISSTGEVVLLSPELAGIKDPRYGDFRAGNVLQGSLVSILSRAHRLRYVREFVKGLEACEATCEYFGFCRGAPAGNRYFEHGRLDATETDYCRASRQALITAVSDIAREEQRA
ncbi:cyclophane-forming radical SAM peptide maturase AmcB [Streptomyces sp. SBT349]|uniref:cyclophane-forming radical SAM peptide maturase AmcB n=1 Tax=Streptomyces sp. SBT349 TaxID=1580539 RepID=UPI000A3DD619|nr:cyclophane-forming radical SAM peptide maturase AmcB [Streptomyces sp. SBT349]